MKLLGVIRSYKELLKVIRDFKQFNKFQGVSRIVKKSLRVLKESDGAFEVLKKCKIIAASESD